MKKFCAALVIFLLTASFADARIRNRANRSLIPSQPSIEINLSALAQLQQSFAPNGLVHANSRSSSGERRKPAANPTLEQPLKAKKQKRSIQKPKAIATFAPQEPAPLPPALLPATVLPIAPTTQHIQQSAPRPAQLPIVPPRPEVRTRLIEPVQPMAKIVPENSPTKIIATPALPKLPAPQTNLAPLPPVAPMPLPPSIMANPTKIEPEITKTLPKPKAPELPDLAKVAPKKIEAPKMPELPTLPKLPAPQPIAAEPQKTQDMKPSDIAAPKMPELPTLPKLAPVPTSEPKKITAPKMPELPQAPKSKFAPQPTEQAPLPPLFPDDPAPPPTAQAAEKLDELPPVESLFADATPQQTSAPDKVAIPALPNLNAENRKPLEISNIQPPKLPDVMIKKDMEILPPPLPKAPAGAGNFSFTFQFKETETELPVAEQSKMLQIADSLKNNKSSIVTINAYASGESAQASQAKRTSLARALSVRRFLLEREIPSDQIVVHPYGNESGNGVPDRVDVSVGKKAGA